MVKHARYYWLLLAEGHLTRRVFAAILRGIWALPLPVGKSWLLLVLVRLPAMRCKNWVAIDATCLILLDVVRPKRKSRLITTLEGLVPDCWGIGHFSSKLEIAC